jgi:hypothetical protein
VCVCVCVCVCVRERERERERNDMSLHVQSTHTHTHTPGVLLVLIWRSSESRSSDCWHAWHVEWSLNHLRAQERQNKCVQEVTTACEMTAFQHALHKSSDEKRAFCFFAMTLGSADRKDIVTSTSTCAASYVLETYWKVSNFASRPEVGLPREISPELRVREAERAWIWAFLACGLSPLGATDTWSVHSCHCQLRSIAQRLGRRRVK